MIFSMWTQYDKDQERLEEEFRSSLKRIQEIREAEFMEIDFKYIKENCKNIQDVLDLECQIKTTLTEEPKNIE